MENQIEIIINNVYSIQDIIHNIMIARYKYYDNKFNNKKNTTLESYLEDYEK
jgi:hypothetical protein